MLHICSTLKDGSNEDGRFMAGGTASPGVSWYVVATGVNARRRRSDSPWKTEPACNGGTSGVDKNVVDAVQVVLVAGVHSTQFLLGPFLVELPVPGKIPASSPRLESHPSTCQVFSTRSDSIPSATSKLY